MKKYEVIRYQDHYRLTIETETYDEINKIGGMGFDVIMAGSKDACLKKKKELEDEEKNNSSNNNNNSVD